MGRQRSAKWAGSLPQCFSKGVASAWEACRNVSAKEWQMGEKPVPISQQRCSNGLASSSELHQILHNATKVGINDQPKKRQRHGKNAQKVLSNLKKTIKNGAAKVGTGPTLEKSCGVDVAKERETYRGGAITLC